MINALFLINYAGKAGTERYVRTLAEGAAGYGVRPFFAYNEPGPLYEQMRGMGVDCRQIAMRNPFDIAAAIKLARICGELDIDVIHTNYLRENYIAVLAKLLAGKRKNGRGGIKVIYTNHYVVPNNLPVRLFNRLMTRADHRIISVCHAGAPLLIANGAAKDRIVVIHNAIDPDVWRPGPDYGAARARVRREYGAGDNETVFLCASRFAHDKGHSFLVESLARLSASHGAAGVKVLLAGDGPLEQDVRARVKAAGLSDMVRFTGFVADIKPLFYASDVYLNPSQHEALSFLIIEALAAGLPVIAADMGGNREIVNADNGCGILVRYGDAEALCAAMQTLRTDGARLREMRENAFKTVERDFALNDMLAKTFAQFK